MVKVSRIVIDQDGLAKFFSNNECGILEILWEVGPQTSSQIQAQLDDLSLACVAGTLDRLVKSGFVEREIDESETRVRYIYQAASSREEAGAKISERVIDSLVDTFGDQVFHSLGKVKKKRRGQRRKK